MLLAVLLAPATAAGATTNVAMTDSETFSPASVGVARGGTVKWTNGSGDDHDVWATRPSAYFSSGSPGGVGPGEAFSFTFPSAGRYRYICRLHDGMAGAVKVPVTLRLLSAPARIRVTIASAAIPAGSPWIGRIQVKRPGGAWATWKDTRATSLVFTPSVHGTYQFRAALIKASSPSVASDYSDPRSIAY